MAGLDIKLSNIENHDSAALAEMTGAIDGNTVPSFQSTLEEIKTKGIRHLVLDMSKIKYVNSTGLGSLVKYADAFNLGGGGMALIKVPPKVKIVVEMLGLDRYLVMCADLEGAITALENGGVGGGGGGGAAQAEEPKPSAIPPRATRAAPAPAPGRAEPATAQAAPVAGGPGFPKVIACKGCRVQLEVPAAGNWKCPRCYQFVALQADGSARFAPSDRPVPVEVTLTATPDCGEGLVHLVTSVCTSAFNGQKLQDLRVAVHEVAQVLQQSVYSSNPQGVYHVSIERQPGRVQIRFADSGAQVAAQYFPNATRTMAEFECRPHPSGGNTIRLVQTG